MTQEVGKNIGHPKLFLSLMHEGQYIKGICYYSNGHFRCHLAEDKVKRGGYRDVDNIPIKLD